MREIVEIAGFGDDGKPVQLRTHSGYFRISAAYDERDICRLELLDDREGQFASQIEVNDCAVQISGVYFLQGRANVRNGPDDVDPQIGKKILHIHRQKRVVLQHEDLFSLEIIAHRYRILVSSAQSGTANQHCKTPKSQTGSFHK